MTVSKDKLGGAGKGAALGATVGSAAGPVGTVVGGVAGGIIGYATTDDSKAYSADPYNKAMQTMSDKYGAAYTGNRNDINNITQTGQDIADQGNWKNKLIAANTMRRDANAYEKNAATQGVVSAYGGDPLSGGAVTGINDRQAQLARQNWRAGLEDASGMIDTTTANKLNVNSGKLQATTTNNLTNMGRIYNEGVNLAENEQNIANAEVDRHNSKKSFVDNVAEGYGAFRGGKA